MALRKSEDLLCGETWRHYRIHLTERFCARFGEMRLNELTADHLREWLSSLRNPRTGEPMDAATKQHHRKDVNTFLIRARREGWILSNPCELVTLPREIEVDVTVIPVDAAIQFFRANRDQKVIGRLALEAFGGLRYSTAGRIQLDNVNFTERGIEMPGPIHKSGKRKYRQGHPENLWKWLEHAPADCWTMNFRQYREEKKAAYIRASVAGSHNIWRHSFASYLLALTKNLPLVGYLMQHQHTATTQIYEGVASEADAKRYFAITPESVTLT